MDRLVERRKIDADTGCWIWTGARSEGYGQINIGVKLYFVHRLAFEAFFGTIPGGLFVLHHCDNRACFNPSHLFTGTQKDNVQDCLRKGRCKRKLTDAEVLAIRSEHESGDASKEAIARRYGISPRQVGKILTREAWGYL